MYLLTRPLEKAQTSAAAFAKAGISVNVVALVSTPPTPTALSQFTQLSLAPPDIMIVTSTQAAKLIVQHLSPNTIQNPMVAIGETTYGLLKNAGFNTLCPAEHTSESLLALPIVKHVSNKSVAIVKGAGGRTLINDALFERGAIITQYNVYERKALTPAVATGAVDKSLVSGVIATSAELAHLLIKQYPWLADHPVPWLTVSERIAGILKEMGMTNISVSTGASDKALIKWVQDFWE